MAYPSSSLEPSLSLNSDAFIKTYFLNLPSLANLYPITGLSQTTSTMTFWQFANL